MNPVAVKLLEVSGSMSSMDYRAEISSIRMLGSIGSILMILSILVPMPYVVLALRMMGIVFMLGALKDISNITGDRSVFRNALTACILFMLAGFVSLGLEWSIPVLMITTNPFASSTPWYSPSLGLSGLIVQAVPILTLLCPNPFLSRMIASGIPILALLWILLIVASYLLYRSYNLIVLRTGVWQFPASGVLYLVGSILAILGTGPPIILTAVIIQMIAFFTLPSRLGESLGPRSQSSPTT